MRHKKEMKSWFLKRGYLQNIINREMEKVKFKKQIFSRKGGVTKGVPSVIKYLFFTQVSGYYFAQTFIPTTYG